MVHGLENVGMMNAFGPAYILGVGWSGVSILFEHTTPSNPGRTWPGQ